MTWINRLKPGDEVVVVAKGKPKRVAKVEKILDACVVVDRVQYRKDTGEGNTWLLSRIVKATAKERASIPEDEERMFALGFIRDSLVEHERTIGIETIRKIAHLIREDLTCRK
jgi:hypothetical protein